VRNFLDDETFCFTYGDGVSDLNIRELIAFHHEQNVLATVTAVRPPGRFGAFSLREEEMRVETFREKPRGDGAWINGGFFVLEPEVVEYIEGDDTVWEREPMERLAREGKLAAFRHTGFWHPMDTLRDKMVLEDFWKSGDAPWKAW
jgi:glucose-1-phosphate cytidylyltransferase